MIHEIDRFFGRMRPWQLVLWCTLMVGFVGAIDGITGNELSFAVFYLLPVSVAAWYGGVRTTCAIAILATLTWFTMEYLADRQYSHQWILFWNSAVRLLSFSIVAVLLRQLHAHVEAQGRLARTDPLTGLLNRGGFLERSEALVNSASRYGLSLVIAFIDLDGFKNVNDSLGHTRGDELLRAVGAALDDSIRESDIAGRLGGDEFAVLLPNTDLAGADAYFAKLHRQMLEAMARFDGPKVGVSIGAMVFEQGPPHLNEALRMADELMYRAKKGGRTSVIVATPPAARLRSAGDAA